MQDATSQAHTRRRPLRPALRKGLGLCIFLLAGLPGALPAGQEPAPQHPFTRQQSPFDDSIERDPVVAARQLRARNADRQKSIVTDTEKLLRLARELNSEMETGNHGELTQVELHKLAEIERLARNVKQKMSISFVGGPLPPDPDTQWIR
jgi:hypothetical protein